MKHHASGKFGRDTTRSIKLHAMQRTKVTNFYAKTRVIRLCISNESVIYGLYEWVATQHLVAYMGQLARAG